MTEIRGKLPAKANDNFIELEKENICSSIQHTIVKILIQKLEFAAKKYNVTHIAIAGGVSANSGLRNKLKELAELNQWSYYIPAFKYCTDNAAMIAMAAHYKYLEHEFVNQSVTPNPRMKI